MIFHLTLVLAITTAVSSRIISHQVDLDGMTNSDSQYEITHIYWPKVQKRSLGDGATSSIHLKVFGEKIDLLLHPVENVLVGDETPVFTMKHNNGVPVIKKSTRNIAKLVHIFESIKHRASLSVTYDAKRKQRSIMGFIESYNLTIYPVPDHINCSIDEIPLEEIEDHHCHLISQAKLPETRHRDVKRDTEKLNNIRKLPLPTIVYPEIMVIVDYNLHKVFNLNPEKIVSYLLSFWNAVDMKFRSLTNPKILLNIAGIILIETDKILPYMEPLKENKENRDVTAVRQMGEWLYKYQSAIPVNYDIAVTMTTTQLDIHGTTAGLAPQSGMCQKPINVAMIRDYGGYHAILTTAHELGHSMGANHDEDYTKCNYTIPQYIMSEGTSSTINAASWSECSIEDIQKFLQTDPDVGCLYNKPKIGNPLVTLLPGKMMTADEQCQKIAGGKVKKIDEDICHDMRCFDKTGNMYKNAIGAADGTPCAKGKICINSNCVSEH